MDALFDTLEPIQESDGRRCSCRKAAVSIYLSLLTVRATRWLRGVYSHYHLFLFGGFSLGSSSNEAVVVSRVDATHEDITVIRSIFVHLGTVLVLSVLR